MIVTIFLICKTFKQVECFDIIAEDSKFRCKIRHIVKTNSIVDMIIYAKLKAIDSMKWQALIYINIKQQ